MRLIVRSNLTHLLTAELFLWGNEWVKQFAEYFAMRPKTTPNNYTAIGASSKSKNQRDPPTFSVQRESFMAIKSDPEINENEDRMIRSL